MTGMQLFTCCIVSVVLNDVPRPLLPLGTFRNVRQYISFPDVLILSCQQKICNACSVKAKQKEQAVLWEIWAPFAWLVKGKRTGGGE